MLLLALVTLTLAAYIAAGVHLYRKLGRPTIKPSRHPHWPKLTPMPDSTPPEAQRLRRTWAARFKQWAPNTDTWDDPKGRLHLLHVYDLIDACHDPEFWLAHRRTTSIRFFIDTLLRKFSP